MRKCTSNYSNHLFQFLPDKIFYSVLLFGFSLILLRQQIAEDLHLGFQQELHAGILLGWMDDLLLPCLSFALALCMSKIFQLKLKFFLIFFASLIWISTVSNTIYARFFQSSLSWWVLRYQWQDIFSVGGSAGTLAISSYVFLSGLLMTLALVFAMKSKTHPIFSYSLKNRVFGILLGTFLAISTLLFRQSPVWLGKVHVDDLNRNSVLTEHILITWSRQIFHPEEAFGSSKSSDSISNSILSPLEKIQPASLLYEYSHFSGDYPSAFELAPQQEKDWSLQYPLQYSFDEQRKLRQQLGLNPNQAPNVIVLFLESVRAFELEHPQIGPALFPNLRAILAEHSVHFQQAYSSSGSAGQTVRGQFSTLCSHMTDQIGPAEYIAYPSLQVTCLADLFKRKNFQTLWFNSHRKTFHNKSLFESIHGTDYFFDRDYFFSQGIQDRVGDWGFADLPVLQQVLTHLESLHQSHQPFFANVLTISTHHPFYAVPQGIIPDELHELTKDNSEHTGYMSRLRYADQALGAFFNRFFKSSIAENTVVVLLGDHSINVFPNVPLKPYQQAELRFRIPLAFISKNIPKSKQIQYPVHQIDVAPTIARLAGLEGEVSWMGRDLLSGEGSPWIAQPDSFYYRTRSKLCLSRGNHHQTMDCFKIPKNKKDPLFDSSLAKTVENRETTLFFRKFIAANHLTLIKNLGHVEPHQQD